MSGSPILVTAVVTPTADTTRPAQPPPPDAAVGLGRVDASTSQWFERTRYYAEQAVAKAERGERKRVERRLDQASQGWTKRELVRTYRANADGDRRFTEEADILRLRRYVGWLETGPAGDPLRARLLVGTRLASHARRDRWHRSPNMTVTWTMLPAQGTQTMPQNEGWLESDSPRWREVEPVRQGPVERDRRFRGMPAPRQGGAIDEAPTSFRM
jgi:hypothetical protein